MANHGLQNNFVVIQKLKMDQDFLSRRAVERHLAMKFTNIVNRNIRNLDFVSGAHAILYGTDFSEEESEIQALRNLRMMGYLKCFASFACTLVVLRSPLFKLLVPGSTGVGNGLFWQNLFSFTKKAKNPFQNHPEQKNIQQLNLECSSEAAGQQTSDNGQRTFRILSWTIDVTISLLISNAVSIREDNLFIQKLAHVPLVAGRSRIAEACCSDLLNEFNETKTTGTPFQKTVLQHPETSSLKAMLEFCNNCQKRFEYENMFRQQNGLARDQPVIVPFPGVPPELVTSTTATADLSNDFESFAADDSHPWTMESSHDSTSTR